METAVLYNVPHEVPWKIYIPLYFYFTGLSAGSFILSTLSTVFGIKRFKPMALPAAIISFLLLLLAPACLILDLHQPTTVLAHSCSGIFQQHFGPVLWFVAIDRSIRLRTSYTSISFS